MATKKQAARIVSPKDFWKRKTPCWEITRCPESIRADCPAYSHRQYACWEIEGTYCKWDEWGALGRDTSVCLICEVYIRWGKGKRIELKLLGQGIKLLPNL